MASAGEVEVTVRVESGPELTAFVGAAAQAQRDAKKVRQDVRYLDRSLARLLEATHALFGISYERAGPDV